MENQKSLRGFAKVHDYIESSEQILTLLKLESDYDPRDPRPPGKRLGAEQIGIIASFWEFTMARLQLDLSETDDALIMKLMEICDLRTKKEVVTNALMLLGWAAKETQRGLTIAAVDETGKTYKEIQTPALVGAQRTGQAHSREQLATTAGAR